MADETILRIVIADDTSTHQGTGQGGGGDLSSGGGGKGSGRGKTVRGPRNVGNEKDDDDNDSGDGKSRERDDNFQARRPNSAAFGMAALRSIGRTAGLGNFVGRSIGAMDFLYGRHFASSMFAGGGVYNRPVGDPRFAGFSQPNVPTVGSTRVPDFVAGDPIVGVTKSGGENHAIVYPQYKNPALSGVKPVEAAESASSGGGMLGAIGKAAGPVAAALLIGTMVRDAIEGVGKGIAGAIGVGKGIASNDLRSSADSAGAALGKLADVTGFAWAGIARGFGHVADASMDLVEAFIARGKELQQFSGSLAEAGAISDVRRTMADFEEAQRLGDTLAGIQTSYDDIYLFLRKTLLPIKEAIAENILSVLQFMARNSESIMSWTNTAAKWFAIVNPGIVSALIKRFVNTLNKDQKTVDPDDAALWDRVFKGHMNSQPGRERPYWEKVAADVLAKPPV